MITKKQLKKLGFEEYQEGYFIIETDVGDLEYHIEDNKIFFGHIEEKTSSLNSLKDIVETRQKLENLLIWGE